MSLVTIESLPETRPGDDQSDVIEIPMAAEDRRRVRRRLKTPDGLTLALALPTGTRLNPGQVLHAEPGRRYVVTAAPEDVLVIRPRDIEEAVKAGHLVGNLHRDIDCSGGVVTLLWDQPLEERLRHEGFAVERGRRPFYGNPSSGHSH